MDAKSLSILKEFLAASLKSFNISEQETNIGVLSFSNKAAEVLPVPSGTEATTVSDQIRRIRPTGGERRASSALELARSMFNQAGNRRSSIPKVFVLTALGDNSQSDNAVFRAQAKATLERGIMVIIISINAKDGSNTVGPLQARIDLIKVPRLQDLHLKIGDIEKQIGKYAGNNKQYLNSVISKPDKKNL